MNVITKELLEQKMQRLEKDTNKVYNNLKALHNREKRIAIDRLTDQWDNIYLDLYQYNNHNINFITDPIWIRLVTVRDIMSKIRLKLR